MSIQHFIDQLCQDIRDAENFVFPEEDYAPILSRNTFQDSDDFIHPWLVDEPEYPIHELFEISPENFPPGHFLTVAQMEQVLVAVKALWDSQMLSTYFPEVTPVLLRYEAIRWLWSEQTSPFPDKECTTYTYVDVCSNNMETCFWGEEFCVCRSIIPDFDEFGNRIDDGDAWNPII